MRVPAALIFAALVLLAAPAPAAGEPVTARQGPIHLRSDSVCTTAAGSHVELEPSYVLSEPSWDALDIEVRRLQESETRLSAENESLRHGGHGGGWLVGAIAGIALGLALGLAL